MVLSKVQEEALVKKYDRLVWYIVHRFKRRNNSKLANEEDLYQECMLVLIQHLRSTESLENYNPPIRDMINAMCRYTLGEQVVFVPKRTSDYTDRINTVYKAVDYSFVDLDEDKRENTTENVVMHMFFRDFISSLSGQDLEIVRLKLDGYRNREVAQKLGISDVNVTRKLKRIRVQYDLYAA